MNKANEIQTRGEETENLLKLLDEDENLDGEALARLLTEQKLDKLKLIAENTIDVICLHHPVDGRYLYASPSTEDIMGYTSENLRGKVPYDFVHTDHHSILLKNISSSTKGITSVPDKLELKFRTKHNGYQWFEGYTKPIFDKKDKVVLVLSCTRNIQDRKIAEIEKKEREVIQQNLLLSSVLLEKKKAIIEKIEHKILELEPSKRKELKSVLTYIQETLNLDENWEDFMIHFKKMHPDFYGKILERYPNLSKKDIKHLAFIKLGMTSSEVAKIMIIKKESLRVLRSRLKKKLKLHLSEDLTTFIQNF
ncbi:PAS sensor protein [Allomuricauda ruestringensis DSM 13258]|uniref:PAS sensor protein n=1 Tax=Allomuricauda ruestringensis (strain DSM 13258 / CIP 107369 / LMG 19739 / B1) TaxID=886377 RepID=G2PIM7_ALLRU|nr:PAS domain S-box protein [Allomuricauda ruestringensis]AEM70741.1 PAS sensor protein [Allomuricauda ruestringensis DSM 13258]